MEGQDDQGESLRIEDPMDPTSGRSRWRRRLRSIEAAAAAGLVAAAGWGFGLARLLSVPSIDASDSEIRRYYSNPDVGSDALWNLQLLAIATIGFLWFIAVIRGRIGLNEPKLFGTVFLGAGILLATLMFVGSAALAAPSILVSAGNRPVDPDVAGTTTSFGMILLVVFAPRVASVFVLSLSSLALRTGALPRWLIILSYIVGVSMFINVTFSKPNVYGFPAWIALVSVVMFIRRSDPAMATATVERRE